MAKSKEKTRTKPKSKSHLPHAKTLLVQSLFLSDDDAKTKVKAKSNYKFGAKPKSKYRVRSGAVEKPQREVLHIQRPNHEKQKCLLKDVGDSKAQLQIEGRAEQEERNFGRCRVCRKENEHFSSACPYWNGVPPGAIVGDGYGVVCGLFTRRLYKNPNRCAHPGGSSKGRLIVAYCNYCRIIGLHWSEKCPERPKDKPYKPLRPKDKPYKPLFISSSKPKLLKKTY
ncbi:hypothetical protein FF1_033631 [Malus domestica]